MPQRNFKKQDQNATVLRRSPRFLGNNTMIQAQPTTTPRRSLRLLAKKQDESDPKTPKTPSDEQKGTMGDFLGVSSCISTPKERVKATKHSNSGARNVLKESSLWKEVCAKENEGSGRSEQLKAVGEGSCCLRRSSRLSDKEIIKSRRLNFDEGKREDKDSGNKGMGAKEIKMSANVLGKGGLFDHPSGNVVCGLAAESVGETKKKGNSNQGNARKVAKKIKMSANILGKGGLFDQLSANVVIGLAAKSVGETKKKGNSNKENARKIAKKFTRNRIDRAAEDSKAEFLDKGASLSDEKISKSGLGPSDQETVGGPSKAPVKSRAERDVRAAEKKPKRIGVKRKRNQVENGVENHGTISGWTKEQDSALQKAYYAANVTPRFWKKVAKMVPGKSAQDCFNKIHADYQTPRQAKPRSKARLLDSSPVSYSASKLLDSIRPRSKRPRYTKRNLVQKTTRQLLEKQCQVNREQNADIFALLEPQISPSSSALPQGVKYSTPKQGESKFLRRCQEPSSSARKMQCSRFNSMNEASLESPPVLKPIKNRALHDKYIDQLHAREAKRRAAAARAAKSSLKVLDRKECRVQKNAVESAKNALLLDARDAINQFKQVQANDFSSFPDDDDVDVLNSDEDINEGESSL